MKYIVVGNPIRAPIRAYGANRALIGSPTTPPSWLRQYSYKSPPQKKS